MKTESLEDSKLIALVLAAIHLATTRFNRYPGFTYMGFKSAPGFRKI